MNAHIKLPKQLDGSKGFITVELAHSNPNATIFWHLDDTYQTQTQDFHKISLQPAPGKHSLTADRKSTRLNSSHITRYRMPSSA